MTTNFPSERSQELYEALTGRRSLIEAGLQTSEGEEYLRSPQGKLGLKMWEEDFEEPAGVFGLVVGIPGLLAAVFGFIAMVVGGSNPVEFLITAFGVAFLGLGVAVIGTTVFLEKKAMKSRPKNAQRALFTSLKKDLQLAQHEVLSADYESMSFTTQHGVVTYEETRDGELAMLLNGSPMRIAAAKKTAELKVTKTSKVTRMPTEPQRYLTSITGQKVYLGRRDRSAAS